MISVMSWSEYCYCCIIIRLLLMLMLDYCFVLVWSYCWWLVTVSYILKYLSLVVSLFQYVIAILQHHIHCSVEYGCLIWLKRGVVVAWPYCWISGILLLHYLAIIIISLSYTTLTLYVLICVMAWPLNKWINQTCIMCFILYCNSNSHVFPKGKLIIWIACTKLRLYICSIHNLY